MIVENMPSVAQQSVRDVELTVSDRPIEIVARDHPAGHDTGWHRHRRAQLIYAETGVMSVTAEDGMWIIPPERAVWVPPAEPHRVQARTDLGMRNLFVMAGARADLPRGCTVVTVAPLMRELIREAGRIDPAYDPADADGRLMAVLLDRIETLPATPLHLPSARDPRVRRITAALTDDPADNRTLAQWSKTAGGSARTLARLFKRDTGMTFGAWRQQARLLAALERLAAGHAVTSVALDLGYDSPSAFTAMFRRAFGITPGRYFRTSDQTRRPAV